MHGWFLSIPDESTNLGTTNEPLVHHLWSLEMKRRRSAKDVATAMRRNAAFRHCQYRPSSHTDHGEARGDLWGGGSDIVGKLAGPLAPSFLDRRPVPGAEMHAISAL